MRRATLVLRTCRRLCGVHLVPRCRLAGPVPPTELGPGAYIRGAWPFTSTQSHQREDRDARAAAPSSVPWAWTRSCTAAIQPESGKAPGWAHISGHHPAPPSSARRQLHSDNALPRCTHLGVDAERAGERLGGAREKTALAGRATRLEAEVRTRAPGQGTADWPTYLGCGRTPGRGWPGACHATGTTVPTSPAPARSTCMERAAPPFWAVRMLGHAGRSW